MASHSRPDTRRPTPGATQSGRGLRISIWTTTADQDGRRARLPRRDPRIPHHRHLHVGQRSRRARRETVAGQRRGRSGPLGQSGPHSIQSVQRPASSIRDNGRTFTVVGRVRDNSVAASLLGRRPDTSDGRNSDTRITWPGGTSAVRVRTVESETTSTRASKITLTAERTAENRSNLLEMGDGGKDPGRPHRARCPGHPPRQTQSPRSMSFMVNGTNPLPALEAVGLPEDSVESVGLLLVTELLVGERGVDHITSFHLGPKRSGRRRLSLAWMPPKRYTNVEPVERSIDGETPPRSTRRRGERGCAPPCKMTDLLGRLSALVVKSSLSNLCRMLNEC